MAILDSSPLLTIFVVVALGSILGAIPLGRIRIGAAGALFVGLAMSARFPELGAGMDVVQSLGLALFVYTVGIASGAAFFAQLRRNLSLLLASVVAVFLAAGTAVVMGILFGIERPFLAGLFTGATTAAPALATATRLTDGSTQPAIGYAFGYPLAVIIGIILVSLIVGRAWPGLRDTPSLAGSSLDPRTITVEHPMNLRDIPEWADGRVRVSYLRRGERVRVALPGEDLEVGDDVVVVGLAADVEAAAAHLGHLRSEHLADDRSHVDFNRLVVSNPDVAARSIGELNLPAKYGAVVTRVRRGDLELLARDDFILEPGDRVTVVAPRERWDAIADLFGDSERSISEIDVLSLSVGMVAGLLLGFVTFPLPGGQVFQLGTAAGPLIAGMFLGAARRTGPFVWAMPEAANLTMRQLGLTLFLAGLGLTAGPGFAQIVVSPQAVGAAVTVCVITLVSCAALLVAGAWVLRLSAPRTAGAIAGFLGQPAVLDAATSRVGDERIDNAYAALFAFSIVVKIFLVPAVLVL
ncbi:aspartate:alanine exchanger family transporter [Actinotignum timonense]